LYIEKIFRMLAAKYDLEILGSYDPIRIGCAKNEFYDGMHPKEECMTKAIGLTKE
jgi:hypothetical protein